MRLYTFWRELKTIPNYRFKSGIGIFTKNYTSGKPELCTPMGCCIQQDMANRMLEPSINQTSVCRISRCTKTTLELERSTAAVSAFRRRKQSEPERRWPEECSSNFNYFRLNYSKYSQISTFWSSAWGSGASLQVVCTGFRNWCLLGARTCILYFS